MRFTITEIPIQDSGAVLVHWLLYDGSDGACFTDSGVANTIPQALIAITRARRRNAAHFHPEADPMPYDPPHLPRQAVSPHVHTPDGYVLAAQQDRPTSHHL